MTDPMDNVQPLQGSGKTVNEPNLSQGATKFLAKVTVAADFRPRLDRPYVVKGWLSPAAMSVVYGDSNVGKTFFALDLCYHVAKGQTWSGCRVHGGATLYIAAEGGLGVGNRIAALADREGVPLWTLPTAIDLCKKDADTKALIEMIAHLAKLHGGYALIVIDTLARAMGNGDENASPDMGAFVRNIDRLRATTGAHVMAIHHAGKDSSKGARGHSSLRAATDTEIELTKEGSVIVAEARKQRDMPGGRTFAYQLAEVELGRDQDGDKVTTCVVAPCEAPERMPKLSGSATIALQALDDALAQHGAVRQQEGVPNCTVVSIEKWREMADLHGLSDSEDRDNRKRAFNRARKTLMEHGYVRQYNNLAWRASK
jgi:hypothetical protein